jgi:hypothetical protein
VAPGRRRALSAPAMTTGTAISSASINTASRAPTATDAMCQTTMARPAPERNGRPDRGPRWHCLPFEVHRVAEYVAGLALVALPFSFSARMAPAGLAGVVMVALAVTTRGRLGLLRWWSLGLHHVLDVAAVLLLAAMPLVPGTGGWLLAVFLEPTAVVLALLTLRTNYRAPQVTAPAPGAASRTPFSSTQVEAAARGLAELAARLWIAAAPSSPGEAARGRATPQGDGGDDTVDRDSMPAGMRPAERAARLGRLAGRLMESVCAARRKDLQ